MHHVKADCVQGGAATNRVRRKMSIAVATNGPFGKSILLPFCWTVCLEK